MNQVKIFLFVAILFLLKTQASEFKIPELVYKSRTYNFDYRILGDNFKYTFVPVLRVANINASPVHLQPVVKDTVIQKNNYTGPVVYECAIDERGRLSAVFLVNSLNAYCDSLVLEAIKKSQYSMVKNKKGEGLIVLFFVTYLFTESPVVSPIVNGMLISNNGMFLKYFTTQEVDRPPILLSEKVLYYPDNLNRAHKQGKVVLQALVNEDGYVVDAVIKFAEEECIYVPALEMIYQYRYEPALKNGKPVPALVEEQFEFKSEFEPIIPEN